MSLRRITGVGGAEKWTNVSYPLFYLCARRKCPWGATTTQLAAILRITEHVKKSINWLTSDLII